MEKTQSDWINEIDFDVQNKKLNNRNLYMGLTLDMNQSTANAIKKYFEEQGNTVEIRMCPRKKWDIIITW